MTLCTMHCALCTTNYALVSAVSETHLRFKDLKRIIIIIAIVINNINIDIYIIITKIVHDISNVYFPCILIFSRCHE